MSKIAAILPSSLRSCCAFGLLPASFGRLNPQEHFLGVDAQDDADRVGLQHLPC